MKKYILLAFLGFSQVFLAQINPIGFQMTLKGKVEIITENQNIKVLARIDSVFTVANGDTTFKKLFTLDPEFLVLLSPPNKNWTDASLVYSGIKADGGSDAQTNFYLDQDIIKPVLLDSSIRVIEQYSEKPKFEDEVIFHGDLSPELKDYFKKLLDDHIEKHKGIAEEDDDWDAIGDLLAYEDTVEDGGFIYPGLVDKLVFYKYEDDRLSTITGYYFNMTALERDSLQYDEGGNLIYFHRETIGYGGERLYFTYNDKNQLIEYRSDYYDFHSDSYDPCPSCKVKTDFEHFFFTYDENGYLNSKDNKTNEYTPHYFLKVVPNEK